MIYLMAPYSHSSLGIREHRAQCISLILGELMQQFPYDWIFSPITQGHATVPYLPKWVAEDHGFWLQQCEHALHEASRVFLLPLPGWKQSKGIAQELDWCEEQDKPVVLLNCVDWLEKYQQLSPYSQVLRKGAWQILRDYMAAAADLHTTGIPAIIHQYNLSTKSILVHTERSESE